MTWTRFLPSQRVAVDDTDAAEAVKASREAKARNHARWDVVRAETGLLRAEQERNHLAERIESAMRLKPRHP